MNRIASIALRAALASLVASPAIAQHFASPAESIPGEVYPAMNLNPPGVTGTIYNDGTIEAPPPEPVEAR
jgi:hypothetical protein